MNKRGFFGMFILVPIFIILYIYCWIFIFGPVMAEFGTNLAVSQGMTGFEGLVWRTMNIWAGLVPLLLYIAYQGFYGGNG